MTEVFVVLIQGLLFDVDVEVFSDSNAAIARAMDIAVDRAPHPSFIKKIPNHELGFHGEIFHVRYSCAGDSVSVLRRSCDETTAQITMMNKKSKHFWITIDSNSLLGYFEKIAAGQSPDDVMIELYLNSDHDDIQS